MYIWMYCKGAEVRGYSKEFKYTYLATSELGKNKNKNQAPHWHRRLLARKENEHPNTTNQTSDAGCGKSCGRTSGLGYKMGGLAWD